MQVDNRVVLGGTSRLLLQLPMLALGAAVLVGCASTGPMDTGARASADIGVGSMAMGARAAPPAGFIDFCSRQPADCGLKVVADAGESPGAQQAATQKTLYRQYLWAVAFPGQSIDGGGGRPPVITSAAPYGSRRLSYAMQTDAAWRSVGRPGASMGTAQPESEPAQSQQADYSAAQDGGVTIQATDSAPAEIALTEGAWSELNMVNRLVNGAIRQASDMATHGTEDYWDTPLANGEAARGDCEDYVLEKRRALIARGVPAAALSIAVVQTRQGEGHAILLVNTNQGEVALDSLEQSIVSWRDVPYSWVERQVPGQPMMWVRPGQGGTRGLPGTSIASADTVLPGAG